jgi:cupin 2 domain-containing protein
MSRPTEQTAVGRHRSRDLDGAATLHGGDPHMINLFDDVPVRAADEIFSEILAREHVRIERIVSTGQSTPMHQPLRQAHDEWVLILAGAAGIRIEGEAERSLRPGDHLFIAAHSRHWVTWTAMSEPTIWLAVHLS